MHTADLASIKSMLTGAEGARLEQIAAGRSSGLESEPSGVRGDIAKHLSSALNLSEGEERFSATAAKYQERLTARAQAARDEAVAKSQDMQNALGAESAALLVALDAVVAQAEPVGSPQYELLNKPFLIWPSNSVDLEMSEIVESNSRAKFRLRTEDSFYGSVSFYYLWNNPKDKYAVVDVHGYAIFNGTANVGSGGGLFPGSRSASARVTGSLGILEWWNQPPTSPLPQPDQSVVVLDLYVRTDGFGEVGALDFRSIFRGYDLSRTLTLVPPFGTVVLLVTAGVSCETGEDSGLAEVDFASGAFSVGSPAVFVTVLS